MTEKIISTTDKLGNPIEIYHSKSLTWSPAYPSFLRGLADLMEQKFRYPIKSWDDALCGVFYATHNDIIIGHVVYNLLQAEDAKTVWVIEGAVERDYRQRGIYTELYKHLENFSRSIGCLVLASTVHRDNLARLSSAAKIGMVPIYHQIMKRL